STRSRSTGTYRRQHRGLRIFILEILVDYRRVVDRRVLIDQHRHSAERVQPEKFRAAMLALPEIHRDQVVSEALFGQDNPHLLAIGTRQEVVEFDHIRKVLIPPRLGASSSPPPPLRA